ncbi:hypothetical protein ACWDTI_26400 [Gordonia sp. NPDC003424]
MMTVVAPDQPVERRRIGDAMRSNVVVRAALRWVFLAVITVFAYWHTLAALAIEFRVPTLVTYIPAAVVLSLMAAVGIGLRQGDELPIYDRQTDVIVGVIVLILAVCFQALLTPRYQSTYLLLHLDLLSLWLFLLGGAIMLFGLRPVARYRWMWFLLLSIFPAPYRLVVLSLGVSRLSVGVVTLLIAVVAAAIAVGRTPRRALAGAAIAAVVGIALLAGLTVFFPEASPIVYQWVPSIGCVFVTGVIMYVDYRRRWHSLRPLNRPVNPLTAPAVARAAIFVALVGLLVHFVPVPSVHPRPGPTVSGLNTSPPLIVTDGWRQTSITPFDVVDVYGPGSVAARQNLEQTEGDIRFDKDARPRKVVADVIATPRPMTLDVYGVILDYDVVGDRFSAPEPVALPHGVTGQLQTIVDDRRFLTYNRLLWRWNNGSSAQQVSLLSVDNHEPDAYFPAPELVLWRNLNSFVTVLLRGNSVTEDLTPVFKDRDLLVECATSLINAQVAPTERAVG